MFDTQFRSEKFAAGMGKQVGSLHFHVDCGGGPENQAFLLKVAKHFDALGWPSKLTTISNAIAGPHCHNPAFEAEYEEHTPEIVSGTNTFDAYSTTIVPGQLNEEQIVIAHERVLRELAHLFVDHSDRRTVFEIERVSASIDNGIATYANPISIDCISNMKKFEIHHFVDLSTDHEIPESVWEMFYKDAPVEVGGWFSLFKGQVQSFRSVKFSNDPNVSETLAEQHALKDFCASKLARYKTKTSSIIEQILSVQKMIN